MMLSNDITRNSDHIQYLRVKVANDAEVNPASAGYTRPAGTIDVIYTNSDYNLEFAIRVATLQSERRRFSCEVPLRHIFGFCRNVRNVIYGAKHTVALVQKGTDNDAIWRDVGIADGKVILSKLVLWMPVLTPSSTAEERLLSSMDQGGKSLISWLTTTDIKLDNMVVYSHGT